KSGMRKNDLFMLVGGSVVLYDALSSALSKALTLEYTEFAAGSMLIYFLSGCWGAWRFSFLTGLAASLFAGLIDATLGLLVSRLIGPFTTFNFEFVPFDKYFVMVASVMLGSSIVGLAGAALGTLIRRMKPKATVAGE
ncbi:MAG: hypothetical protein KF685_06680, partial [Acidobacteria bacterium]|nr:hypothetical protein [Acidobacteriota bacterium]